MDIFEQINALDILKVLDTAGVGYKKDSGIPYMYTIKKSDGSLDNSFKINTSKNIAVDFGGNGIKGGCFDIIGRLVLQVDTSEKAGKGQTAKWFIDKGLVDMPDVKRNFIKSLKDIEVLEQYDSFKLNGYKNEISNFLLQRGVPYDFIQKNHILIGEIFKDIGYYDNYFCTEHKSEKNESGEWVNKQGDIPQTVGVFLFPCYKIKEGKRQIVGIKLRRKDGKTIRGQKSIAIGETGLLFESVSDKQMLVVEGEMDYLILKILGYANVVGNLGGVQSQRQELKGLLCDTTMVLCLYDGDTAGLNGKQALLETLGRAIWVIDYPIREDLRGKTLVDVNDFYNVGYNTKAQWDKLLKASYALGSNQEEESNQEFVYIREYLGYYDTVTQKPIVDAARIAAYLGNSTKELAKMVTDGFIKKYKDLCYCEGGKPGHFNTLNEKTIVKHGGDTLPVIHPDINFLINNIGNNKKVNVEWLHKAILYKLTHINDVRVPALILYGPGRSGKGTLINLLSKIFGDDNVLKNLKQKDLESNFDSFRGNKLVVEFQEVSSSNTYKDKQNLDRIKSMVGESTINVRALYQNSKEVQNIAWFHISSNHNTPIQLDSKHSGNNRFTIIKTGGALDEDRAKHMNQVTFKNKMYIKQYVSWLYEKYSEAPEMKAFPALQNNEKKQLEDTCEGEANLFFEWLEAKYPHITKITLVEKNALLDTYILSTGEDPFDNKYKQKNFDSSLSHRYEKKTVRVRGNTVRGYFINKTEFELKHIPDGDGCFEFGELEGNKKKAS